MRLVRNYYFTNAQSVKNKMSYHNYWSWEANEAHQKGHEDERYRRNSYDYEEYRGWEIDEAYFQGRRDERQEEERRREEKEQDEEERRHYAEMMERHRQEEESDELPKPKRLSIVAKAGTPVPIWILWSLDKSGSIILRAILLTKELGEFYKAALEKEIESGTNNTRYVHLEERDANHLYGGSFLGVAQSFRGFLASKWREAGQENNE